MTENSNYSMLNKTISILIVDDDPGLLDFYESIISGHPLYTVVKVSTSKNAEIVIRSHMPHICFLDLGLDDVANDEFYLLRKYSKQLSIIIMSASTDIERAFQATKLGVSSIIAKPPDMNSQEFWVKIGDLFLQQSILPLITDSSNSCLRDCCRILKTDLPTNVSDWAHKVGITDTYLRKLWGEYYSFSPKHVLFMYKFYKDALSYFDARYTNELNEQESKPIIFDSAEYERQAFYFLQNRLALEAIIKKKITSQ